MKIMHIEAGRYLYGGPRQVVYLIAGLAGLGVDNCLVCRSGSEIVTHASGAARVIDVPMHGDIDFGTVPRLARIMAEERPNLVHVHSRRGIDLFGGLAARHVRAAAVVTRRVDNHEPALWLRLKYRPYDKIVAISRRIESQLVNGARIEARRVARIPSAVDTSVYRPAPAARSALLERMGLDTEDFVIGMAGQLIARKGHRVLLNSLPEVLDAHPRVRVLLFGRGPLEAAIRRQIETLGIGGRARLLGYRDDFVELLSGLDLLVHPARREGMGLVVLEALACGVPVIASRVGGIVDVIEDGVHGILVPPDESRLLGRAMSAMIADADTRRALAQAGRQRVREHFSVEAMTSRYKALYASVLSS